MIEIAIREGAKPIPGERVVMTSGRDDDEPDVFGTVVRAATNAERTDLADYGEHGCIVAWDGGTRGFEYFEDMLIVRDESATPAP